MNQSPLTRFLCLLLAAALTFGLFPAVSAAPSGLRWELTDVTIDRDRTDRLVTDSALPGPVPTDPVRVSIVLEDSPVLRSGFSARDLTSARAAARDLQLLKIQKNMEQTISARALDGQKLDVVWNLTLVSNIISANVPYGKIEAIAAVPGVREVIVEQRYSAETAQPQSAVSTGMTGASILWQGGLTGAGSRIAVIDTGTDTDHQSFDSGAYLHALRENAAEGGMEYEAYLDSLDLLDAEEIAAVLEHLNAFERIGGDADEYYLNEKLPFGANYIDWNLTVDHDHDAHGSHGSHVAGIAAANRFIPQGSGYADSLETVHMSGVAPDAQIITLKVFGNGDGPFDSDYFAAIEDALWLGCDSVNLSLGSANPGVSSNPLFADLLDYMETTDTVVAVSAGNSGHWAEQTAPGALYSDGVSFHTGGAPGSYTGSLTVASVENDGAIGEYLEVAGRKVVYTESLSYYNQLLSALDTSPDGSGTVYDYLFIDGFGYPSDYEGMDLFGKIVFCSRGELSFSEKANNAVRLGAAAVVVYNDQSGIFGMDLSDYRLKAPCVSIIRKDADAIRAASEAQTTEGGLRYYTGTAVVSRRTAAERYDSEYPAMSLFSSWGVPGSLELKPEITAPGGGIRSVNGVDRSGTAYELMSGTSMAAPQVSGMAALISEYIRTNGLDHKTGLTVRQLAQSLLMSTALPLREETGEFYSVLQQGAGLARVDLAVAAEGYVLVEGMDDGKVKAELGEDPERTGVYSFSFTIHDLSGVDMAYDLSAEVFTQALLEEGSAVYLDTATRSLPARIHFTQDGRSLEQPGDGFRCDLNGDGRTTADDADHLLEHLVDGNVTLFADGDVSGDGIVSSYDAHVLLTKLSGSYRVDVPAGGSAAVEVRLDLTDGTREYLDAHYPTGAYIEAFVTAAPLADAEGKVGVTHSIPVLGYYGSWTEPGMLDIGSYPEYEAGTESRTPYLYQANGFRSNFISISYGGREEYLFGGNPYVQEDTYLPRRNAFNNTSGYTLRNLRFSLIRNAMASLLLLENEDTGEVYLREELGPMEGAYYHVNAGSWQNTQTRLGLGLDLAGIPEGTHMKLSLLAAPELYCAYDPIAESWTADWEKLAEGAYLRTSFTIDNTAPAIKSVELGPDNVLRITARDNEYIAAAALLNPAGTSVLTAAAANQTQQGAEMTIPLDLSQVYGSEFLVAVYDYAENSTVCSVTLELDTERPRFTAIDCTTSDGTGTGIYMGFDKDTDPVKLAQAAGRPLPRAAAYAEGAVFEISEDEQLYAAYDSDLTGFTCLGPLDPGGEWEISGFCDLDYNRSDGMLYALFYSRNNNMLVPYLAAIDPITGAMTVLGQMPIDAFTLAIDGEGSFYSTIYSASQLYRYQADVIDTKKATLLGPVGGYRTTAVSSLAWDHSTGELFWACDTGGTTTVLQLDPASGQPTVVCRPGFQARGLYITYAPETDRFAPTERITSVTLPEAAETLVGNTVQLNAQILPWNVASRELLWTSSDSAVASVDENGLVTGLSEGIAVITAASVLDGSVSASCTVTIRDLDRELKALVWDQEGDVWWSSFRTGSLPDYEKLQAVPSDLPLNATMMADGQLYASTLDISTGLSELYRIAPGTYETTLVGPASIAYADMAYAPSLGCGLGVYFNYVVLIDLQTGEYVGAWDWAEGVAADLVGITYCGTVYNSDYGANMDLFLLLDSEGRVYQDAWIRTDTGTGYFNGPAEGFITIIGDPVDTPYFQGFHYDGSYAYWTRFHEADNAVELIAWDCNGSGGAYSLGFFEDGVWPVGGLYTDADVPAWMQALPDGAALHTETAFISPSCTGGLNAAAPLSHEEELIRVPLTVPADWAEPTNGIFTVTFDPALLELAAVSGKTEAFAWRLTENGQISIAFADRAALAPGAVIADLAFRPLGMKDTALTLRYDEWNQEIRELTVEIPVELPRPNMPFVDVPEGSFFYDPVLWAVSEGITTGATETAFDPTGDCLRAFVVTFLWRSFGCPEPVSGHNPFTDVRETDFFYKAVLWAVEKGITNGTSATTFSPYAKCNRAQVVTFLWRAMGQPDPVQSENPFTDVVPMDFYGDAVLWAVEQGITNGMGDGTFGVGATCNRAQVVTFLYRTLIG